MFHVPWQLTSLKMATALLFLTLQCALSSGYALQIEGCDSSNWLSIYEDKTSPISCLSIPRGVTVVWDWKPWNNSDTSSELDTTYLDNSDVNIFTELGNCTNFPCEIKNNRTSITSLNATSTLVISKEDLRTFANGTIRCSVKDNDISASCMLRVIHQAQKKNCSVQNNDWQSNVEGFCNFTKYFVSDGTYQCQWQRKNLKTGIERVIDGVISVTTYNEPNEQLYYRGTCTLSDEINENVNDIGNETYSYSVRFYPWGDWELVRLLQRAGQTNIPGNDDMGKIVAGIVGGVVLVILILLTVILVITRRPCFCHQRKDIQVRARNKQGNSLLSNDSTLPQHRYADIEMSHDNPAYDSTFQCGFLEIELSNKTSFANNTLSISLISSKPESNFNKLQMTTPEVEEEFIMTENEIYEGTNNA